MPWPKPGATPYHLQLGLPEDGRVGCMQWLGSRAFEPTKRSGPRHNLYPKNLI